jgi:hypothetical protein
MNMKSTRKSLTLESNLASMSSILADGNMAAFTLLLSMARDGDYMDTMLTFLGIDDLNLRGEQVYVAFKHCNSDIPTFVEAVGKRDQALIDAVNKQVAVPSGEQAFSGASFKRR